MRSSGEMSLLAFVLAVVIPSTFAGRDPNGSCKPYAKMETDVDIQERILLLPKNQDFSNKVGLGILYFVLMGYLFLGIAIASHIFMCSIEVIVSKTRTMTVTTTEDGIQVDEKRKVKIWNDTIANLTLMALGSSAPEILLSIIETVGNDFCAGALGPGTIVGSASYNLLIITAVCIVSVPNEGIRRIKEYKVFLTTSGFAVFAYVWMVVILQVISQNQVEVWEAVVTLVAFPVMVGLAYWAELDFCTKGRKVRRMSIASTIHEPSIEPLATNEAAEPLFHFFNEWDGLVDDNGVINNDAVIDMYKRLQNIAVLSDEEIATILATKLIQFKGHSVLWYKIRAIQALVAGNKALPTLTDKLNEVMDVLNDLKRTETGLRGELRPVVTSAQTYKTKAVVEFPASCFAIPVFVGKFTVILRRGGREDYTVFARLESYDGSAKKNVAYEPVSTDIVFEPYVVELKVPIIILGEGHTNRDSNFFLKLSLTASNDANKAVLGPMSIMEVVIMDIDQPGEITFTKKGQVVGDTERLVELEVERVNGADGLVTAKWRAIPCPKCTRMTEQLEGSMQFEHGEMKKVLEVPISAGTGQAAGENEQFDVEFYEIVGGGGKLGKIPLITVAISANSTFKLKITRITAMAQEKIDECPIIEQTYWQQIKSAFIVNGGVEESKFATGADKILHWFSLPWKMLLCFLPPPYFLGGWPCFLLTLAVIGLFTAVVGDMATIFGHCISLDPVTTAITCVAIGTSLPDTFASRFAAMNDKTADAAIGNITGSNSVNVFLGLGLPWTIAAIYTQTTYPDQVFAVNAVSLALVVTIYTLAALIAQGILWMRRKSASFGNAELGGPVGTRWLTSSFLVLCWLAYVFFSIILAQGLFNLDWLAARLSAFLKLS